MANTPNTRDIDALVDSLTLDEQIALLAGEDMWQTVAIERAGIPSMRVTDGPAGARGTSFTGVASVNIPCATALASSWDPALVERIGQLLGREVRRKGARVHLAPTVNMHRTPVGGRNFECFSEDPHLTSRMAVAYVRGVQSEGVASCIKHFLGNDTEFERMTIDSQIDERTMREVYLAPFEAAVAEADVMSVMSSYNRLNGTFAADHRELLTTILRDEWGFDGVVMSDWHGLHSTAEGVNAGLDLEMPGPTAHRGHLLRAAVDAGDVSPIAVRTAARNILSVLDRTGAIDDGGPGAEITVDDPSERALVREAACAGMVLVRNETVGDAAALPLVAHDLTRVAVIGPNARHARVLGGGSAHVNPPYVSHPLDALCDRLQPDHEVLHHHGCLIDKTLPALDAAMCSVLRLELFADPDLVDSTDVPADLNEVAKSSKLMWQASPIAGQHRPHFGARLTTEFTPHISGTWDFGLLTIGDGRLLIDGTVLIDNSELAAGGSFFGLGKAQVAASIELEAGRTYRLDARMKRELSEIALAGLHVGAREPEVGDPVDEAANLAATCDVSIVVVGTNSDWESEGWDRADITLPGRQDELVEQVARVSKKTIVVVNAGSPVAMPWIDRVDAVIVTWFSGQEMGNALVDVLLGVTEPGGRLPVTFPRRMEDTPAFEFHPGRNGAAKYLERRLIGHRWYDTVGREPLFAFGHGLGYSSVVVEAAELLDGDPHQLAATVRNTGAVATAAVVQVYATRLDRDAADTDEPAQRLVGAIKQVVPAGAHASIGITLDPRSYLTWSVTDHAWVSTGSRFELRIGLSSRDIAATVEVSP